ALGVLPARLAPAQRADRRRDPRHQRPAALLPRRAGRPGRAGLRDAQVPDAGARRRGPPRPLPRRGARPADAGPDDDLRPVAKEDPAGRDPAAPERAQRRHEPRRAAADPAALLRGARSEAARLLAAAHRPPRPDRLRADPARLRDLDGGEARARPGVDRRPFGSALPAHDLGDVRAPPPPVAPITAAALRALDVEPRVLEVEVAAHAQHHVTADVSGAAELRHRIPLGIEQLPAQALVRLRLLLDGAVVAVVEPGGEAVDAEAVEPAHALGRLGAHPVLAQELAQPCDRRLG